MIRTHSTALFCILSIMALSALADEKTKKSDGVLLVANKGDRSLGIVDPATAHQVAAVAENGVTGHEVIASPDGKTAYVPIYGDSGVGKAGTGRRTLAVIDVAN